MKRPKFLAGLCLVVFATNPSSSTSAPPQGPGGLPAQPLAQAKTGDEKEIGGLVAEFTRAFNAGDAKALAPLFTDNARIVTMSDRSIEGREAIESLFATAFQENPGQTIEVKPESLRFLGPEAAIEEGTTTIHTPQSETEPRGSTSTTRYSAAYVKRNGKWLQDSVRDYPAPDSPQEDAAHERLKELEWLVGEWIDESDDAEVHTTCRWAENQSFLLRSFQVTIRGKTTTSGSQRIGWDARLKQFRSWVFDSDGGFSEGLWSRNGDRWVIKSSGVLKDGRIASATNIITRVGRDTMKWTSVGRTLDAEVLPDAEEITLVRKPPQPRPARPRPITSTPPVRIQP
jgi:uncharacterized protein (TIGR02246 family)